MFPEKAIDVNLFLSQQVHGEANLRTSVCGHLLSPSFTTSVTEMCVTPVCRCSSDPSYNVTVICYTDDAMYDLKHSIKKAEEIVALYVNSYDSLFYILSSSSVSFLFAIA